MRSESVARFGRLSSIVEFRGRLSRGTRRLVDVIVTIGFLAIATAVGMGFDSMGMGDAPIVVVYVLSVQLVALFTTSRALCVISTALSVLAFNYFFSSPRLSLAAWGSQYPGEFIVMCIVAFVSSEVSVELRQRVRGEQETSRLLRVLLETDHMLQGLESPTDVLEATGAQLAKLLDRDVVWYESTGEKVEPRRSFSPGGESPAGSLDVLTEPSVAMRAFENGEPAGEGTPCFSSASGLYLPVGDAHPPEGVMGLLVGDRPLESKERGVASAVVGEATLALGRIRALREREQAQMSAEKERLRANLLRSISHDLRTPLTSIIGSVDILLDRDGSLDDVESRRLLGGVRSDATWLSETVENLLAITRLENGGMRLSTNLELMDDVIEEALRHVDRRVSEHSLVVEPSDGDCLVDVDARLMVQVVVNLVNNAVKYTPAGSHITIALRRAGKWVETSVSDDGPGIPPEDRSKVFDTFYTVGQGLADGHRSFGLGLSLCKSIVEAHGGSIWLDSATPHGCVFAFTLPARDLSGGECR